MMTLLGSEESPALIVCGWLDDVIVMQKHLIASEFDVFKCGDSNPIIRFGALDRCEISLQSDSIIIYETIRWPFGKGWKWQDVKFIKYVISREGTVESKEYVLTPPSLTKEEIESGLSYLEKQFQAANLDYDSQIQVIGVAFTLALTGNKEARDYLENIRTLLHTDGHVGETASEAIRNYRQYSEATGTLPQIKDVYREY
jgi:hypothetical protein